MALGSPEEPFFLCQWDPQPGNQQWRIELLERSFEGVSCPGKLIPLPYAQRSAFGDYYSMNKPLAVQAWLGEAPVGGDDVVVLLDPDMVFVAPWAEVAPLAAQSHPFLADPEGYQLLGPAPTWGFPWVFDVGTLRSLIDRWIQLAEWMWVENQNWTAEMRALAYVVAGREVDERTDLTMMNDGFGDLSAPLIHYAYHSPCVGGAWTKHEYRPGNPLPVAVEGTPRPAALFYEVLARYHGGSR